MVRGDTVYVCVSVWGKLCCVCMYGGGGRSCLITPAEFNTLV